LSGELKNRGVSVVAVCPSWTKTDMGGHDAPNSIKKSTGAVKWLCLTDDIESGKFYENRKVVDW
jgi:short-subunit dehydrogenase